MVTGDETDGNGARRRYTALGDDDQDDATARNREGKGVGEVR